MSSGVFASAVPVLLLLLLLVSGPSWAGSLAGPNVPRVCIDDGCMCGSWMRSVSGERYEAFLGIPFAKPPVGELRFADPVPNDGWEQELDVSGRIARAPCLQENLFLPGRSVEGSEDCLYLNVYRPTSKRASASPKLPTVVYIHGGGYLAGYNSPLVSGAEKLMDHPVIVVAITYRLGALGFLSTGDEAASGNFGLKDQRLALRWVNRNIAAFGGDPQLVTILGQSAGGASVQLHMMHLANEGLFQRAVSLSGSALAPWSTPRPNPELLARQQAALLGIQDAEKLSTAQLVAALRAVEAERIVTSFTGFMNGSHYPMIVYGPVVEKPTIEGAFLTAAPAQLWSQGAYLNVPWLTGTVSNDGFIFSAPVLKEGTCSVETFAAQQTLLLTVLGAPNSPHALTMLAERFFGNASSAGECFTRQNIDVLTKIFNEALFVYPLLVSAQQYSRRSLRSSSPGAGAPVHLYKFNYRGTLSYSSIFAPEDGDAPAQDFGTIHCDELLYLFRAPSLFPDFPRDSPDVKASQRLTRFLVNFARTGAVKKRNGEPENPQMATNDDEFPPGIEFFNNANNPERPLGLRPMNVYDADVVHFWTRFYKAQC